jgi:hypothetical protein
MTALNSPKDPNASTSAKESFVAKFRLLDRQGVEGLKKRATLWSEYKGNLNSEQFAECTVALGLSALTPKDEMMEILARRFARANATLQEDYYQWAILAVLTTFNDQIFESFLQRALRMKPMLASEILEEIMAAPLDYRVEGDTVHAKNA